LVVRLLALALLLCGCRLDVSGTAPLDGGADADPCSASEILIQDDAGATVCAQICANQLHCWSGCCLPAVVPVADPAGGETDAGPGLMVCMPESVCFPDAP
jgi:hypothetical protein